MKPRPPKDVRCVYDPIYLLLETCRKIGAELHQTERMGARTEVEPHSVAELTVIDDRLTEVLVALESRLPAGGSDADPELEKAHRSIAAWCEVFHQRLVRALKEQK